jgi:hypothetical protein
MTTKIYKFNEHLLKLSNSNELEIAKTEWFEVLKETREESSGLCICQHKIKHIIYMYNKFTKYTISVGTSCCKKFKLQINKLNNQILKNIIRKNITKGEYKIIDNILEYTNNIESDIIIYITDEYINNKKIINLEKFKEIRDELENLITEYNFTSCKNIYEQIINIIITIEKEHLKKTKKEHIIRITENNIIRISQYPYKIINNILRFTNGIEYNVIKDVISFSCKNDYTEINLNYLKDMYKQIIGRIIIKRKCLEKSIEEIQKQRIEKERLKRIEKERLKRIEKERLEKIEKERLEKIEKERLEKIEKERLGKENNIKIIQKNLHRIIDNILKFTNDIESDAIKYVKNEYYINDIIILDLNYLQNIYNKIINIKKEHIKLIEKNNIKRMQKERIKLIEENNIKRIQKNPYKIIDNILKYTNNIESDAIKYVRLVYYVNCKNIINSNCLQNIYDKIINKIMNN